MEVSFKNINEKYINKNYPENSRKQVHYLTRKPDQPG